MAIYEYNMLTAEEVEEIANRGRSVAVLPLGSTEQHGPHLSVGTDYHIAVAFYGHMLKSQAEGADFLIMPPLPYTCSVEHINYKGTVTLTAQTTMTVLMEIGESLMRADINALMMISTHGGNQFLMEVVARNLRVKGMHTFCKTVRSSMSGVRYGDNHAGEYETSVMMTLGDAYVKRDKMDPASVESYRKMGDLVNTRTEGSQAWIADDVMVHGVCGDPYAATLEKGTAWVEEERQGLVKLMEEIAKVAF